MHVTSLILVANKSLVLRGACPIIHQVSNLEPQVLGTFSVITKNVILSFINRKLLIGSLNQEVRGADPLNNLRHLVDFLVIKRKMLFYLRKSAINAHGKFFYLKIKNLHSRWQQLTCHNHIQLVPHPISKIHVSGSEKTQTKTSSSLSPFGMPKSDGHLRHRRRRCHHHCFHQKSSPQLLFSCSVKFSAST